MGNNDRNPRLNIAIVEDEAQVAKRVARLTREILGERVENVNTFACLDEAGLALVSEAFDLLILDLNLNGEDGFELLRRVAAESFHTIVVSAYKERALEAFDFGVLDFVPKPIDERRLRVAFERLLSTSSIHSQVASNFAKRLAIKSNGLVELIPVEEISHISGADDYSEVFLKSGKSVLSDKTLNSLDILLGDTFIRIHRSHIVRTNEIKRLRVSEGSRYNVDLPSGVQLPVGRSCVSRIRELLLI